MNAQAGSDERKSRNFNQQDQVNGYSNHHEGAIPGHFHPLSPELFDGDRYRHQRKEKGGAIHIEESWEERHLPAAGVTQANDVGVGMVYADVDIISDVG